MRYKTPPHTWSRAQKYMGQEGKGEERGKGGIMHAFQGALGQYFELF